MSTKYILRFLLVVFVGCCAIYLSYVVQYQLKGGIELAEHRFDARVKLNNQWLNTTHEKLKIGLNTTEHELMIDLIGSFDTLMRQNNVTYIMCDGTLLGSYFFHDFIPWDDDLDVMVSFSDRPKLSKIFLDEKFRDTFQVLSYYDKLDWYSREVLEGRKKILEDPVEYARLANASHFKFKFYKKNSPRAGNRKWGWPFMDVKFYDDTHDWVENIDKKDRRFNVSKSEFLPLHSRPFGHLWLPAPRNTRLYLQTKYKQFQCRTHSWDHKNEKYKTSTKEPCSSVYSVYPHVERFHAGEKVQEKLFLGSKLLQSVFVDEPWYNASYQSSQDSHNASLDNIYIL